MESKENLINEIIILKEKLENSILSRDGNLIDPKIVKLSQQLDEALNKYNKFFPPS